MRCQLKFLYECGFFPPSLGVLSYVDGTVTSVRTRGNITSKFLISIGFHQRSSLNLYLFQLVMDELTKLIQDEVC